jgi:hypothetical protein
MKKILYFILALAMLPALAPAAELLLDDCDHDGYFNKQGGMWVTYNDSADGGTSKVWPPAGLPAFNSFKMSKPGFGGKGYAVRITGKAGTKLGWDFIGVVMLLNGNSGCPFCKGTDISKYKTLEFKIKGKIKRGHVMLIIPYESSECVQSKSYCKSLTRYADYQVEITDDIGPDWYTVIIDLRNDLNQPDWVKDADKTDIVKVLKHAHSLNWQYKGGNGAKIDMWIDDIKLY